MAYNRPKIDVEIIRDCKQVSQWKSLTLCTAIYVATVGMAMVYEHLGIWWVAIPFILIIAALQNHLTILLHEGAHHLLHPNRAINDLACDIFCAYPFGSFQVNYRTFHLNHHKFSGSPERDPEVKMYEKQGYFYERLPLGKLLWLFFKDLCGINLLKFQAAIAGYANEQRKAGKARNINAIEIGGFLIFWGVVGGLLTHYGVWFHFFLFWIVPMLWVLFPLVKLHGYGEHTGATGPTEYQRTWVHDYNPIANFFIYPIKSGFHLEHHFFPMIPWFHMERFRKALMELDEFATESELVTVDGFFFGKRTIFGSMLLGKGEYRTTELSGTTEEIEGDVIAEDAIHEIDEQLA